MFKAFIKSCGGSDTVRRFLDAYLQGDALSCVEGMKALRGPQSVGFEVVLLLLLCLEKSGGGMARQARSLGEQALTSPQYPPWDKNLVRIVMGQLTADAALKGGETTGTHDPILAAVGMPAQSMERRCQAFYYQAARLMWLSPDSDFRKFLRDAILTAACGCLEFQLAMAHLQAHLNETGNRPLDLAYIQFGDVCSNMTGLDAERQLKDAITSFEGLSAVRELRVARGILSRIGGSQVRDDRASAGPVRETGISPLPVPPNPSVSFRCVPDAPLNTKPAYLRTLEGHSDWVTSVNVTSDGRHVISGSKDTTLRLWDLESGECLRSLKGHSGGVRSVCVTSDGRCAVSGSDDHTLRVWDLESGACQRTLEGHSNWVISVSVTPDGRRPVSAGSRDNTVRVWDLVSCVCLRTLQGHSRVMSVSVTLDGRCAVSGSDDHTLRVWDLESGMCLHTLNGHGNWVTSVSVTPDGLRAVSGSTDKTLRVWDLESGMCLHTLEGHGNFVTGVSVTPDGRCAVSGSDDNTLRIWDLESGQCLCTLKGHAERVNSVSVTPDGRRAVSGSYDNTVRVWDLPVIGF